MNTVVINTNTSTNLVPNRTDAAPEIISAAVSEYVTKWVIASKKSVNAILEQAELIQRAKNELPNKDYRSFLVEADISESSAKKWLTIAKKAPVLWKNPEVLPPNWTTIYKLASEDEVTINKLFEDNLLSCNMSSHTLSANVTSLTADSTNAEDIAHIEPEQKIIVKVFLNKIPAAERDSVIQYLQQIESRYSAVEFNKNAAKQISTLNSTVEAIAA